MFLFTFATLAPLLLLLMASATGGIWAFAALA